MESVEVNQHHATALRVAATGTGGETDASLRAAAPARAAGGPAIAQLYDDLARQIGQAAYRVTDAQVAAVREVAGKDRGAFEVVMAACIGAGLARWDAAVRAIEEAGDAAS
jgi:hypothetical protein